MSSKRNYFGTDGIRGTANKRGEPIMRLSIVLVMCLAMLGSGNAAHAKDCTLHMQEISDTHMAQWRGACIKDVAQGDGAAAVKASDGSAAGTYYGKAKDGAPYLGIYEVPNGFRIIAVDRNTDDAQTTYDAFTAASHAAYALSKRYAAEGNKASAAHYKKAAKALNVQIE